MLGEGKTAAMIEDAIEDRGHTATKGDHREVLKVTDVTLPGVLSPISLTIREGEILGIGGLVGSGRTELLRCISGLEPHSQGKMEINGRSVHWPTSVRQARALGIILVPEDRKGQGIIPLLSAAENIGIGNLKKMCKAWPISQHDIEQGAESAASKYGFDTGRLGSAAGKLSGGNQQKLLLARAELNQPRILLADEPTRGIDIGAKAEIMESLRALADQGCAVVVVSSELEEIVAISDRVAVLHEGNLTGELDASESPVTISAILNMAFGVEVQTDQRPTLAV